MSASVPFASFFRKGSGRFVLGGAVVFPILLMARLHMLAALSLLVVVAAAGAIRRLQDQSAEFKATGEAGSSATGIRTPVGRPALEAKIDAQWNNDQNSDEPTALLLIRVDSLDALEQLREKGSARPSDVAMLTLASSLVRMLPRQADMLACYDESTFAVVLSGTDLPGSLRVAARLRWAIVRLGIANPGTASGFLTACMGLAVHHGPATGNTAKLMVSAEKMLAAAQRVGEDSLEYEVLGTESRLASGSSQQATPSRPMPAVRAWTPEQVTAGHSPQA